MKFYQSKSKTYIEFEGQFYQKGNQWDAIPQAVDQCLVESRVSMSWGWIEMEAATLDEAIALIVEYDKKEKAEKKIWSAKVAEAAEKQRQEDEAKFAALEASQPIPATVENIRLLARHLNGQNWGTWRLPSLSIGYSAHQYDCDGRTATTITLDQPVEGSMRYVVGAPNRYLMKFQRL